jgi:AsmA protein
MSSKKIDITELRVDIAKVLVMMQGNVSYTGPISFALDLNMPETKLASLQQIAGPFLPAGTALGGAASLAVSAEKSANTGNRMAFKGQLLMNNATVTAKGFRPVLSGTVRFTPDLISLDGLRLVAGSNSAEISGQVKEYGKTPDIRLDIRAASFNVDALVPPAEGAGGGAREGSAGSATKKEEKEFGPVLTKARAEGSVEIGNIIFRGVSIRDFRTAYALRDNIFQISSMTGNTLSGNFRFRSAVDLSAQGTSYTMNADTNGMRLEDITAAFAPKAKDTLYGVLSGKMEASGAGSLAASIKRNLKGQGTFSVKDGKIRNAKVSSGLLAFLGLQNLREIPMDKADGSFTIADGTVHLTSMITGKDLIIDEKGTIGMDERLDLGVLVKASEKLSPKMLSQSSSSQFLSEEKGWTVIPLKVGGTITNPSYGVDMHYVGKRLQKKAEEEVFRALSGDKEKKDKASPQDKKKSISPEDLLKGFFK